MAIRYPVDALKRLRESPLCSKPSALPPAEEWMGPPPETFRNNQGNKPGGERNRNNDSSLLDPPNRRLGVDRARNAANSEDIVLGPPRMTFSSATISRVNKPFENDKSLKDSDTRDRFPLRNRNGDADNSERFRDRGGDRDTRNAFRRRGDADQDSEGWSTVKPRKSFGHEGAERFHGRMGERPERFGGDRRPRDQDDRENADRPRRAFGEFSKDKEGDEGDKPRRNGLNRNRADQPWLRDNNEASQPRERFDRSKSWRDRDDHQGDAHQDRPRERTYERRWDRDRDQRQEREPEWLDEPVEEQPQAHTQEDFKKFMENMKAGKSATKAEPTPAPAAEVPTPLEKIEVEKTKVKPTPAIEMRHDKFFAAFGSGSNIETQNNAGEATKENSVPVVKPKTGSRFQKLFLNQEESRRQAEPPIPVANPPPAQELNPLLAMTGVAGLQTPNDNAAEKVAFQALLQKLQKQKLQGSTPPSGGFADPPPNHGIASPGPYQPYVQERREEPLPRGPPQNHDAHTPRPQVNPQFGAMRSEQQVLHDLIGQRHPGQNQNAGRSDQPPSRNNNSQAEFLMTLMQSARQLPEAQRNEQLTMRMPQPSRPPAQILPTPDRELDYQHERVTSQHQSGRPTNLAGFFDEASMLHREQDNRPQQPTQILQRQGPPGLDQMHPGAWIQNSGQQMPPPGRPMIPPPGLAGNPRNGPGPGGFPPGNFPMGAFPPEGIAGPPRNMAPPPGFFGGPPPPGFMPPGIPGFQGPESGFGFDHRGMPPPPGTFRRN